MIGEEAELSVLLTLRDQVSRGIGKVNTGLTGLVKRTEAARKAIGKIGQGLKTGLVRASALAAGGIGFLALNVKAGIESLAELEVLNKKTVQALRTTGREGQLTAQKIRDLANKYEDLTRVDDKVIQNAENILLTFTNIRTRAFEPAIAAALDMSAALGTDLVAASRLVGRALSDPIKGISALSRYGVQFTERERDKIATLVKSNRTFEAQQIILRKLNRMYGGQGAAAANTYRGRMQELGDAVETLQQNLARALLPALTRVARRLSGFLKRKDVQEGITALGDTIAGLFSDENLDAVGKSISDGLESLKNLDWAGIRSTLDTGLAVTREAFRLFNTLPPEVRNGLVALLAANKLTGGLVAGGLRDLAGLALSGLRTITAQHVTVVGSTVTGPGGPGGPGGPTPVPAKTGGNWLDNLVRGSIPYLISQGLVEVLANRESRDPATPQGRLNLSIDTLRVQRLFNPRLDARTPDRGVAGIVEGVLGGLLPVLGKPRKDPVPTDPTRLLEPILPHLERLKGEMGTVAVGTIAGNTILDAIQLRAANIVREATGQRVDVQDLTAIQRAQGLLRAREAAQLEAQARRSATNTGNTWDVLGRVRSAVLGVQSAVQRKDLSVTVHSNVHVSAREVASEVRRFTENGGGDNR